MYTISIKASFKFLETFDNRVSKFLGTYVKKFHLEKIIIIIVFNKF